MRWLSLILIISTKCFAFENAHFKQIDPSGWIQQPANGVNYLYLASVSAKEKLPVFVSMTSEKKIERKEAENFLRKTLKDGFKNAKKMKIKKIDKPLTTSAFNVTLEFSYYEDDALYKGLVSLMPGPKYCHYFQFTAGTVYYDNYKKDVVEVLNSTKLK